MTTAEILCMYSSVKGHRTRVEYEIASLLELLNAQYSSTLELRLNDRLEKLEKHSHKLLDISEYLISIKYPKARDHSEEVEELWTLCISAPMVCLRSYTRDMLQPDLPLWHQLD